MEDREAVSGEEREAVEAGDDVEAHSLPLDDKSAFAGDDEDKERRLIDSGT